MHNKHWSRCEFHQAESNIPFNFCLPSSSTIPNTNHHQKPRKNRTKKWIEIESYLVLSSASTLTAAKKPKFSGKRPDPSPPKITRPCSECGKKFWSWKALCGHMRCHPERQWCGINPPPNYRRSVLPTQQLSSSTTAINVETPMTDEDHDVASCLLMLANSDSATLLTLETTGFGDGVRGICNNNRTSQVEDDDWEKGEEASISSSMNQGFHFLAARERPQLACRNRR